MPIRAKELSALEVSRLKHPGGKGSFVTAVGGVPGLYLQLLPPWIRKPKKVGGKEEVVASKTWILRTKVGDKTRDIGLGGYPEVTLAVAREKARELRAKIRDGIDPVEERKAARAALAAAQKRGLTFAEAVDRYLETKLSEFRNEKHQAQWRSTLDTYAKPALGDMQVQEITVQDALRALQPIWQTKTETASRLRQRMEAVLSWATVAGHRSGDNPARWGGNLKELLPKPSKVAKKDNHPALSLTEVSAWFASLRKRDGMGARALEFLTLCASRSGEVRGATWDEIDLKAGLWVIPAARMKMDREHRVPLPPAATALLEALPRFEDNPLVFPATRGGQLSDMTLSATMKRMHEAEVEAERKGWLDPRNGRPAVPHGLRSTFRDWAAETGQDHTMAEIALAHRVGSEVERAYRRGDMLERRRDLMTRWSEFCVA